MDPRCKGMPLSSFILKPMQRVTRYPLIIKNVSTRLAFSSRGTLSQHFRDLGSQARSPTNAPGICCVDSYAGAVLEASAWSLRKESCLL